MSPLFRRLQGNSIRPELMVEGKFYMPEEKSIYTIYLKQNLASI
jgi:hypothetical protein